MDLAAQRAALALAVRAVAVAVATLSAVCVAAPAAAAPDPPKRPVPDYDGRGPEPTTAGDVALWVPRILLSPLYLTSEYLVRRPLGWLITTAEHNNWAPAIVDFFTFGEDHNAGIVPTAFYEFNFRPSIGLYFFWNDVFAKKNDVRLHGSIGGLDWASLSALDRIHVGKTSTIGIGASFLRRPDYVFHGLGSRTLEANRSRFTMVTVDAGPEYDLAPVHGVHFLARVGFKSASLSDGHFDNDPPLSAEAAGGAFAVPPGFPEGYRAGYEHLELSADSREPRPLPGSGVRASTHFDHGTDLQAEPGRSWIRYGGAVGGFWDITGQARTVALAVTVDFAQRVHGGATPFTERVVWGGGGGLAGFRPGRLVGDSGATATLYYEWPIWVWLDGTMHVTAGNVFDAGLRNFDPKLLRISSGIGLRSTSSPDHQVEILIGFGTETFDQGLDITTFRFAVGGTNGF